MTITWLQDGNESRTSSEYFVKKFELIFNQKFNEQAEGYSRTQLKKREH